jgi:hypothetical protein
VTTRLTVERSTAELLRIFFLRRKTPLCKLSPKENRLSSSFLWMHKKESDLHLGCKSFILFLSASLAQRLEHRICNARVVGSIPTGGLSFWRGSETLDERRAFYCIRHCLGRLMDGPQPSKLFCIGSNPIRDEKHDSCVRTKYVFLVGVARARQATPTTALA